VRKIILNPEMKTNAELFNAINANFEETALE